MKIACVLDDMFEDSEFKKPFDEFKASGYDVTIVGTEPGKTVKGYRGAETATIEKGIQEVSPDQFDALFIPGGHSPDKLRANPQFVSFTRGFFEAGKPVFAICHGPQLLMTAEVLGDRRVTAWTTVQGDLKKAGIDTVDEEVVVDRNLVSSRKPDDIPAFIRESKAVLDKVPAGTR